MFWPKVHEIEGNTITLLANAIVSLKNLEELELQFTNVHFKREKQMFYLFSCIAKLKYLKKLSLQFNSCYGLTNSTILSLSNNLAFLRKLEHLNVSFIGQTPFESVDYNRFTNWSLSKFFQSLSKLRRLKNLTFGLESRNVFNTSLQNNSLFSAILKMADLEKLSLKLRGMHVPDENVNEFGFRLKKLKKLKSLGLDFRKRTFARNENLLLALVKIPRRLMSIEEDKENVTLKALSVGFTMDNETEATHFQMYKFAQSVKFLKGLKALEILLFGNNMTAVPEKMLTTLAESLPNLETLESFVLEMYTPYSGTFSSQASLVDSISKLVNLKSLKVHFPLRKDQNALFVEGFYLNLTGGSLAKKLGQCLANLVNLEELTINFHVFGALLELSQSEVSSLFRPMSKLKKLKTLRFETEANIRGKSIVEIGRQLENLPELEDLTLDLNAVDPSISDKDLIEFGNSLCKLHSLRSFKIYFPLSARLITDKSLDFVKENLSHLEFIGIFRRYHNILHH